MPRSLLALGLVLVLPSCGLFNALFGPGGDRGAAGSPYQAAMADYSLCETAPAAADRVAAAARLAQAAAIMAADTRPGTADPVDETDRVIAASARCQASLEAR